MKTVYVFLADGFEEVEALTTVDVLRRAGVVTKMVSVTPDEIVVGAHKMSILCDINFDNCDFYDAAMLVLPGGMPGAETLGKHKSLCSLLQNAASNNLKIAAICAAPMVLGNLDLLKGKKATCYPGFETYLNGAEYTAEMVTCDGNFITGKGPAAALPFALTLAEELVGKEKAMEVAQGMLC